MSEIAEKVKAIIVDKLSVDESEVTMEASSVGEAVRYIEENK